MGHTLFPDIPDFPHLIACIVPVDGKIKTAESVEITVFSAVFQLELVKGIEPPTCSLRKLEKV